MPPPIFVDTSGLVGLFLADDQWHAPARRVLESLQKARRRLLSTSDVFGEVVTLTRRWGGHALAVRAGEDLRSSDLIEFIEVDRPTRDAAWAIFRKHRLPTLSFTDCTSFAVMDRLGLREAFSFDSDFRALGYRTLPDHT